MDQPLLFPGLLDCATSASHLTPSHCQFLQQQELHAPYRLPCNQHFSPPVSNRLTNLHRFFIGSRSYTDIPGRTGKGQGQGAARQANSPPPASSYSFSGLALSLFHVLSLCALFLSSSYCSLHPFIPSLLCPGVHTYTCAYSLGHIIMGKTQYCRYWLYNLMEEKAAQFHLFYTDH